MSTEEMVVLVDDRGRAVGLAPKATVHTSQTPLHRAFSCYVFDADDRLLITRRAGDKKTFPGVWTNSVCGHPGPGETDRDAIARRCAAELQLQVRHVEPALPHFRCTAEHQGVVENEICPVYLARAADPTAITPDPAEVSDLQWLAWDDCLAAVRSRPEEFSPWCRAQTPLLVADGEPARYLSGRTPVLPVPRPTHRGELDDGAGPAPT